MENQNNENKNQRQVVFVQKQKSMGLSIILALLFGPLGLLYASISGGIIMLIIGAVVGFFTAGIGLLIVFPICAVWAAIATKNYNEKLNKQNL